MVCVEERTPPLAEGKKLVIVESPTKMKSIQGYLGDGYEVLSSVGHIRDLADKKDIPADKKQAYGKYSIDIDNGFDPYYVESERGRKTVAELKRALKGADELLLATDEDREGEAIAWHLLEALKPKVPVKRMVFHEITKDAIREAVDHTRELDLALVDAQETRRILDRLYGWDVSPVLWFKVQQGTSAGRVQSAATRMVVERERERMAFVSASYWDIETLAVKDAPTSFSTRLARVDGAPLARGTDFDDRGELKKAVARPRRGRGARPSPRRSRPPARHPSRISSRSPAPAAPSAPFTTSTLQQEAGRKLSMSAKHAMSVAQRLYEKGFITYMRTDSTALSTQAVQAAREQAVALYGEKAVPLNPRVYANKSKNAQEAHEAIRPSGETFRTPVRGRRASSTATSSACTTSSGSARSRARCPTRSTRRRPSPSRSTPAAARPSSRHPAPSTPSRASSRPTKRAATRSAATPTRPTTSRCRRSPSATCCASRTSSRRATRPAPSRATPRRASSRRSRRRASAARRRSRASST